MTKIGIGNCQLEKKYNLEQSLCLLANKVNELVTHYNRIDADHVEVAKRLDEIEKEIEYLLSIGLGQEVVKVLDKWLADGTLAKLINEQLFATLNDEIEKLKAMLGVTIPREIKIGYEALNAGNGTHSAIAIGRGALKNCAKSKYNIAIGLESQISLVNDGAADLSASRNVSIGDNTSRFNVTGYGNCAMGRNALQCSGGSRNVAMGIGAMSGTAPLDVDSVITNKEPVSPNDCIGIGADALFSNGSDYIVGIGAGALKSLKKGIYNVALGARAGQNLQKDIDAEGNKIIAIGRIGTYNWQGKVMTFSVQGHGLGASNNKVSVTYTSGEAKTATAGDTVLYDIKSIIDANTFSVDVPKVGNATGDVTLVSKRFRLNATQLDALKADYNTIIGHEAMRDSDKGVGNSMVGLQAGLKYTGSETSAIGMYALLANATGTKNTALGYRTLSFGTAGDGNTAVGHFAGTHIEGNYNTAVGTSALRNNPAGGYLTNITNATAIGYAATVTGSNQVALGNENVEKVMTYGDFEVLNKAKGVVLQSPNGTKYRIKVSDTGALSTERV